MGRSTTCVCATALKLLGWRGAAAWSGRAWRRSQPGEAWCGPGHHERVCLGPRAARL